MGRGYTRLSERDLINNTPAFHELYHVKRKKHCMYLELIAVGTRMPAWVEQGFKDFEKRMPPECSLRLVEIPLAKRQKGVEVQRLLEKEGTKMLKAVSKGAYVIALDARGQQKSTQRLAEELDQWMRLGRNVAFLVGGPDGLAPECLKRADEVWSLSALTLPHPLVRVILSEQMYRAMSIIKNHPYHR